MRMNTRVARDLVPSDLQNSTERERERLNNIFKLSPLLLYQGHPPKLKKFMDKKLSLKLNNNGRHI